MRFLLESLCLLQIRDASFERVAPVLRLGSEKQKPANDMFPPDSSTVCLKRIPIFQVSMDIPASRRWVLPSEIDKFLSSYHLSAGRGGKASREISGRAGRTFSPCRAFRHCRLWCVVIFFYEKCSKLTTSLTSALRTLRGALRVCPRRPIPLFVDEPAHSGMYSDAQFEENIPLRAGSVMFSPRVPRPLRLTATMPNKTVSSWVSKETHAGQCELFALFGRLVHGSRSV